MTLDLQINQTRLMTEIDDLSAFSDVPAPAVTRILYTETDMAARAYIKEKLDTAGFPWREDAMGNLFARWEGSSPELPAVATGSHIDAIPYSGRYDGVVGVLGAIEALRALKEAGFQPKRSLEVILFTSEEPTRFGVGCLGSRAMAGFIEASHLLDLHDDEGLSFDQARNRAGYTGDLEGVRVVDAPYAYFIELHIEQGPRLEAAQIPIGIVTSIAASSTVRVTIEGDGGHAGTVMMTDRHDALLAASELALAAEVVALESGSPDAVATVGIFQVHPGASNSIPSQIQLTVDLRDKDQTVRDAMLNRLQEFLAQIAERRGITYHFDILNADPSGHSDPTIIAAAEKATNTLGLTALKMVSRAYHDTVFMGQICPIAMLFIPSENGYSHRPEEFSTAREIVQGVQVLALTLAELAQS
ncbi:MAG: M20 family metallo-hydrolase [Chloroflexota bacterium]